MSFPSHYTRGAFKEAGGKLVIEEVELAPPGPGEVLVKVEACGVCFSDTAAQTFGMGGKFPITPGHEIIGNVVATGDGVKDWKVGDRIGGGWHGGHDGSCGSCRKGHYQMCESQDINGLTKNGGYAQYVILRAEAGVAVPAHVPAAEYAPILCAGLTVFNSMRQMAVKPGSTVAIQGLGGLGHLAIQYANRFGYRVVAISRDDQKEKFVRDLGAHEYINTSKEEVGPALQKLGGASLIVATAPNAKAISPLLQGLGPLGKLLILAIPGEIPLDSALMVNKGLSVHGWPSGHAVDSEETLRFTELENIKCMVQTFPLDRANEAFDAMISGSVRFRAVITMQ